MADKCNLCKGKKQPDNLETSTCTHCNESYHKECFRKKYNGKSALPGIEFVCTKCATEQNGANVGVTVGNGTIPQHTKRNNTSMDDEPVYKRPRSNSRGRPAKGNESDIMNFLREFREEMKKDLEDNTQRIQKIVNDQLECLRTELTDVKKENTEIVRSINFLSDKYDEIANKVDNNTRKDEANKLELDSLSATAKQTDARLDKIEAGLNQQAQDSQKNNLVITGLTKSQNPLDTFWKLAELIKADVSKNEVISVELLKKYQPTTQQQNQAAKERFVADTILVRFKSNEAKGRFIQAKATLGVAFASQVKEVVAPSSNGKNGSRPRAIYFRDHMTEFSMELFDKAKSKQTALKYRFLWTKNGRILMRQSENSKVHRISTIADLDKLETT